MRSVIRRLVSLGRLAAAWPGRLAAGVHCPAILRPSDQAVVAVGTFLGLLAMAAVWFASGGPDGRLIQPGERPRLSAVFRVDVNTAAIAELRLLPSIGDTRAQQIISERQRGAFAGPEDLARRIKGIGVKTVAKLKPYLAPMEGSAEPVVSLKGSARSRAKAETSFASATMPRRSRASPPGRTSE
jgi:hypothetical protein